MMCDNATSLSADAQSIPSGSEFGPTPPPILGAHSFCSLNVQIDNVGSTFDPGLSLRLLKK